MADQEEILNTVEQVEKYLEENPTVSVLSHTSVKSNIILIMTYDFSKSEYTVSVRYLDNAKKPVDESFTYKTTLDAVKKFYEIKNR